MFARVLTFSGAQNIDEGVRFVREEAVPVLRQQHGYRGASVSADRSGGVLSVLSLWDTEADREASNSAMAKSREDGLRVIGGTLTIELLEQLLWEVAEPVVPGSSVLLVRRITMDPANIDANVEFFRQVALPELRAQAGFQGARHLLDRETGAGQVGTAWADEAALRAGDASGEERRRTATADRGVTFGEESLREILVVDMP
jgi:heme-degrading monooxygenase HmoA